MVKVEFLGPINKEPIELEISNLSQLREILQKDENVKLWLETSAIAVNDKIVFSKNFKLENGDKIAILPPVCGGWYGNLRRKTKCEWNFNSLV